jgi:nicotinamide-nucleotide amidase
VSSTEPRPATASLLCIGDELLSGDTVNTNAAVLGRRCHALGLPVRHAAVVRDRIDEIVLALRAAANDADVCLVCGGLGPTTDDLTSEAVARAAGVGLERDAGALERLEAKFRAFGRAMPEANRKQADFPHGAQTLANPIGTAEGFTLALPAPGAGACHVFVMPGVPRELKRMMTEQVEPRLRARIALRPIPRRIYRVLGMGESGVAQRVTPVLDQARARSPGLAAMFVHYRASMPEVQIILEATIGPDGAQATDAELSSLDVPMKQALDPALFGMGDAELAARLLAALRRAKLRIGTAESCTAGGVAARLGAVPGASDCLDGAIVAYDDRIKRDLLRVREDDLKTHGAVSEVVARAMAEGARKALGSDLCVSVTGIAGPTGETPGKPVGTVHFAIADAEGTEHRQLLLRGDRGTVQRASELWALKLVWDRLLAQGHATIAQMSNGE